MTQSTNNAIATNSKNSGVSALVSVDAPEPLCVHYLQGKGSRLVVSFAGVGGDRDRVPPPELVGSASAGGQNHVLFITDKTRSWMNAPGVAQAILSLVVGYRDKLGVSEVAAIGNSMGAFSAFVLADLMPIKTVVAFASQYSANPELVPHEKRWKHWRKQIKDWPYLHVGALDAPNTEYFILHGGGPKERRHWKWFPNRKHQLVLRGVGHNLATQLRERSLLKPVIAAALDHKPRKLRKLVQSAQSGTAFQAVWRDKFEAQFPWEAEAPPSALSTSAYQSNQAGSVAK